MDFTEEECLEYTRSDRYASMMLVWRSYNYLSLDFTKYYQRLVKIEQDGVCCGYGPPTRCTVSRYLNYCTHIRSRHVLKENIICVRSSFPVWAASVCALQHFVCWRYSPPRVRDASDVAVVAKEEACDVP